MPCDMVRFPCGSMSTQSTRKPFSTNATARFSVVVVFATPPFWLANAMTRGLLCALGMTAPYSRAEGRFLPARQYHRRRMLCHWDDVPERPVEQGPMKAGWTDLGDAAGSVEVGLRRIRTAPGAQSTPPHAHDLEEELCFVLAGEGLSWQDGTTYAVRAGDALVHLARGPAHTLVAGDGGLEVLMFGQRRWGRVGRLARARGRWLGGGRGGGRARRPPGAGLGRRPRPGVGWLGASWVEVGPGDHPWARDIAAGPLAVDDEPAPRAPGIVAVAEVEGEERRRGDTGILRRNVGIALGSRATGMRVLEIDPGMHGYPAHCHSAEEELFVVLDGSGTLLLGADEHAGRRGQVVARPAGTGVAHRFRAGDGGLTVLAYGERKSDDVAWYPRSHKVFMRGLGLAFRAEPIDYWEGEE